MTNDTDIQARAREIAAGPETPAGERLPTAWMIVTVRKLHETRHDGELLALYRREWDQTDAIGIAALQPHGLVYCDGRITPKGVILARMLKRWRFSDARGNKANPWSNYGIAYALSDEQRELVRNPPIHSSPKAEQLVELGILYVRTPIDPWPVHGLTYHDLTDLGRAVAAVLAEGTVSK